MRLAVQTAYRNTGDKQKALSTFQSLVVRSKYKSMNGSNGLLEGSRDLKRAWPIQELSAFDAAYVSTLMSRSRKGTRVLQSTKRINRQKRTHELTLKSPAIIAAARRESFGRYTNDHTERVQISDVLHGVPLTIDVTQDDETLKLAFSVWLAGARAVIGQAKRPIGAKEFSEWKEYGILQLFDLDFWGQLTGLRYSDSLIAKVLWPDTEVDAEERLRKVSRKKTSEILDDWSFVSRFWRQLELNKFLEKIARRTGKTSAVDNPPRRRRGRNDLSLTFGETASAPTKPLPKDTGGELLGAKKRRDKL